MTKSIYFILAMGMLLGCGQKSTIKNNVKAERLADTYGDGRFIVTNITIPLTDSSLSFNTPIPGFLPIAGGIAKFIGDIFAKNTNMGKMHMSFTHPIPEIPKTVESVRLKRFFLYMKPAGKHRIRAWIEEVVFGKGSVTFSFLDRLAVRMTSRDLADVDHYLPQLITKDYNKKELSTLMQIFSPHYRQEVIDTERAEEIVLLKYSKKTKDLDMRNKQYGHIHILETDKKPEELKHFMLDQKILAGHFKRMTILENSLLIELNKDPIAQEVFKKVLAEQADKIEKVYGVNDIDTCTPQSCLELAVPNVNLVPIAIKGNALELEAIIESDKVPESF